jgi:hypothetical protein
MAYTYFTKKLLNKSSDIDLANVFPEKQERAKSRLNTNYGLPEIVDWMAEGTNNFKRTENYFIDLDQAVQRLVYKYYESTGQKNPYQQDIVVESKAQERLPSQVGGTKQADEAPDSTKQQIEEVNDLILTLQDFPDTDDEAKELIETLKDMLEGLQKQN